MHERAPGLICLLCLLAIPPSQAASVRDFTRITPGTTVSETQASEVTLTLTEAAMRPIQTWVRTAGQIDKAGRTLTAFLRSPEADFVEAGQRVRAYTVASRTRMTLGRISRVAKQPGGATVEATMPAQLPDDGSRYLMEIVVERGPYLSIPNVSIIEEGDSHIVYIEKQPGEYVAQAIRAGLQGELYTQILDGLEEGDRIVSVGSFFVDAENKLKSAGMAAMPGMDHGPMPGMDHSAATRIAAAAPAAPAGEGTQAIMTDPAPNATVRAPLYMIHVMFNRPVDTKSAGFEVTSGDGKPVEVGEAMPMGDDGKMLMAMPKTPLPAGTYNVQWRATGIDGKALQGEFSFTAQ